MSPLHAFLVTAKALAKQPAHFWSKDDQEKLPQAASAAIARLKKTLETKKLEDTIAYRTLTALQGTITGNTIDELSFIQTLATLTDVYRQAPADEETKELIADLSGAVVKAKQRMLEYHLALELLRDKGKKLTDEQKQKSDQETIQKVGIFYVLEYTLQVLYEFTRVSDVDKKKLMTEGLKTDAGNLPGYLPLEDTFRKELCYKIFDKDLRDTLLHAFYNFEEVLYNSELKAVGSALKEFNLALLKAFQKKGAQTFKAMIYKPFGNDISIDELIKNVEEVKV